VAYWSLGGVGLEVGLDGGDGGNLLLGLVVGDELGEFLFEQFVLRFEAGIRPKTFSRISRRVMRRSTAAAFRSFSRV
jgi:hypothetical protein